MQFFLTVAVFLTVSSLTTASHSHSHSQLDYVYFDKLQDLSHRLLSEVVIGNIDKHCPGTKDQFLGAIKDLKECVSGYKFNVTVCQMTTGEMMACFNPIKTVLENCAHNEPSKDIPQFILDVYQSVMRYVCALDGEHILELTNYCYKIPQCKRESDITMKNLLTKKDVSKADFCKLYLDMKTCVEGNLNAACGNPITQDTILGLYNSILATCPN